MAAFDTEIEGYDNAKSKAAWEAFGIEQCCHEHDVCYGTCGKPKKTCDRKLVECMTRKCGGGGGVEGEACMNAARHMEEYSQVAGCGEYKRLQTDGCDCKDDHVPGSLAPSTSESANADAAAASRKEKEDEAAAIEAQKKRDKAKKEEEAAAKAKKEDEEFEAELAAAKAAGAHDVPKTASKAANIPVGKYCAKINAMGVFNVEAGSAALPGSFIDDRSFKPPQLAHSISSDHHCRTVCPP